MRQRLEGRAVFLAADGYHHHVALNTWESTGGSPPASGTTGLCNVALLFPDRPSLARAVRRALAAGIPLEGASDHGVSEVVYLRDPDDNGVEFCVDRPREAWPTDGRGGLAMATRRIALDALLAEAG